MSTIIHEVIEIVKALELVPHELENVCVVVLSNALNLDVLESGHFISN